MIELSEQITHAKQLIKNPLDLPFYYFQNDKFYASKITPKSIKPIEINRVETSASIYVKQENDYYILTCSVKVDNVELSSQRIKFLGSFYYWQGETLNLIDNSAIIRVINFFAENKHELFIHTSQFSQFQDEFLNKLEQSISVKYEYVKEGSS